MTVNRSRRAVRCVLIASAIALVVGSARMVPAQTGAGRSVDDYLRRLEAHGFSGAALVARGDSVLLRAGYGFADWKTGARVDPGRTVFDLASLDKQFIAAGIAKLVQSGKLRFDDPVSRFYPGLPPARASLTIHHLLSHTGGIDDVYWDQHPKATLFQFNHWVLFESEPVAEPGKRWRYSNADYWILEEIVERASGVPWEEFLRDNLFAPASMTTTGLHLVSWDRKSVSHPRHIVLGPWRFGEYDYGDLLGRPEYLRTMMSTADDLFRWYLALRGHTVLPDSLQEKLFTPVKRGYGYGWNVTRSVRGTRLIHHGGAGEGGGMRVTFRYFPEDDLFFTLLSSSVNPVYGSDQLAGDVESLILGSELTMPPDFARGRHPLPKGIEGRYAFADGSTLELQRVRDCLVLVATGVPSQLRIRLTNSFADPSEFTQDEGARRILNAAAAGDLTPVKSLIAQDVDISAMQEDLTSAWRASVDGKFGALKYVTTAHRSTGRYQGEREDYSWMAAMFEHGTIVFRFIHGVDGRYEADPIGADENYETVLAPQLDGTYSLWDPTLERAARIEFSPAEGESPARITIIDTHHREVATRKQ